MRKLISVDDQAHHDFAGIFTNPCQYMAHQSCMCLFTVCGYMIRFHKGENGFQNRMITRMLNGTVGVWYDGMSTSRIKSCDQIAFFVITYRKLRFVAVMIWLVHSHDRLHRNLRKAADPLQAVPYLFLFPDKLLFIAAVLELTATTCTGAVTLWRDTPR